MPATITTAEELLHARDIGRCELVRGRLLKLEYRDGEAGRIACEMGARLGAPAVSFLRSGRAQGLSHEYVAGAPDLAVEVVSAFDRPGYMAQKIADWVEAGTPAIWVVDPDARTVTVHEAGRKPHTLGESETLRGGDILSGFELPVREIFG